MDNTLLDWLSDADIINILEKLDKNSLDKLVNTYERLVTIGHYILSTSTSDEHSSKRGSPKQRRHQIIQKKQPVEIPINSILLLKPIKPMTLRELEENSDEVSFNFTYDTTTPTINIVDGSYYVLNYENASYNIKKQANEEFPTDSITTIKGRKYRLLWLSK